MIKLNQPVGKYYLRFATYPTGDMQQVLEGQAIVAYTVSSLPKMSAQFQVDANRLGEFDGPHRYEHPR